MLAYQHSGFWVDAGVRIEADDRAGLKRLLRYCARPFFAINNRTTARSLNVCPYSATSVLIRRPQVLGSIEATSIVTRGATPSGFCVHRRDGTAEPC